MSELSELYQQVILDHNRNPQNFHRPAGANQTAEGYNPLCGDKITVYLRVHGETIQEIGFEGSGCAISKASGSLMTTIINGKTIKQTQSLSKKFQEMVTCDLNIPPPSDMGKLIVFAGVREFPMRVKCATLAWHTLNAALEGKKETVSTEKPEE
ncbi:MAG: SUF system NifU family Fe-S cluster assembly protein [Deltaproteobacteria bacterium]|nr:SUF system NifU family Fe-S cluster assembly protein [Deltaproteobacteria bacterium]